MRFLILSDMFSLESWLVQDKEPEIMPAVYEFFNYLGTSNEHSFVCFIFHRTIKKTIPFENGSVIHILPITIPFHYVRKFFSMFAMYSVAKKHLKQASFDLVYGMSIYSTVATLLGKRFNRLSVSRIFGSLVNNVLVKKQTFKLFTRYIFQYLEIKYPADLIICTEDGTKFDVALDKISPSKEVSMLYNGMNVDLRKSLLEIQPINKIDIQKPIHFFSIGRLTSWKKHDLVIKTIHKLKEKFNIQVRLSILGQGEDKFKLSKLVNHLKLSNEVVFEPPISHHKIHEYLATQHVGLFLYDVSNMGNAFWESCLSGRFIVTRKNGKINSLFQENTSLIVDSDDPYIIAQHIHEQLNKELEADILHVRNTINNTLANWEDRLNHEMSLIEKQLKLNNHLGIENENVLP